MSSQPATQGNAFDQVVRSIGQVEVLVVALTTLYGLLNTDSPPGPTGWIACTLGYLLLLAVLRALPPNQCPPALRIHLQLVLMVLFLATLAGAQRQLSSPLMHLCLLPVLTSALLLERSATAGLLALVLSGWLGAGVAAQGLSWLSLRSLALVLTDMAPALLAAFLTHALRQDLARYRSHLRALAQHDELSGLLRHGAFRERADEVLEAARAQGQPCAILLVDVDNLTEINERFGHDSGDRALAAVAAGLRRAVRATDLCGRFGGDRYAVLMPGCGRPAAEIMAGRIRHQVYSATQDFDYAMHRLSVSTGLAVQPDDGQDLRRLLRTANRALQRDRGARAGANGRASASGVAPP